MTDAAISRFWATARDGARLSSLPGYLPANSIEMLPPPTWSFGDDAEADALLQRVLDGDVTATSSDHASYDAVDEVLPAPGTLGIVVDGEGIPRALVETTGVEVVDFDDVAEAHARAEGDGDLAAWRAAHPDLVGARVVLERLRVIHRA